MPIEIRGLDHVVLRTHKVDEVLAFYRDKLGCPVERTLEAFGLYQLRAGAALVDVMDAAIWKSEAGPGETLYDHFCLQVPYDDPTEIVAELDRLGIPHSEPAERYGATGNGLSVYATDPDGRTVELKLVGRTVASRS
jgi:catechol 2,3-dioxygenase-like lactoylglutathione lyase family enzyme